MALAPAVCVHALSADPALKQRQSFPQLFTSCCRLLALLNLVAAPFLLVFLVIYFFMKAR